MQEARRKESPSDSHEADLALSFASSCPVFYISYFFVRTAMYLPGVSVYLMLQRFPFMSNPLYLQSRLERHLYVVYDFEIPALLPDFQSCAKKPKKKIR